jgi:hypothetical protein
MVALVMEQVPVPFVVHVADPVVPPDQLAVTVAFATGAEAASTT